MKLTPHQQEMLDGKHGEAKQFCMDKLLDFGKAVEATEMVDLVLTLALSPTWASARPTEASPYFKGSAAEPGDIRQWEDYVRTVAERYKGRIMLYEIWNEPWGKRSKYKQHIFNH